MAERPIIDQSSPNIFTSVEADGDSLASSCTSQLLLMAKCPFHKERKHVENTVASAARPSIL